jgi:hypothetical protein
MDVYVPAWRQAVGQYASILPQSMDHLPQALAGVGELARRIPDPPGMLLTREQRAGRAFDLLRQALALALLDAGWKLCARPGEFHFEREGRRIAPEEVVREIRSGSLSAEAWAEKCRAAGLCGRSASA